VEAQLHAFLISVLDTEMKSHLDAPVTTYPLDENLGVQWSPYLSDYTFVD